MHFHQSSMSNDISRCQYNLISHNDIKQNALHICCVKLRAEVAE